MRELRKVNKKGEGTFQMRMVKHYMENVYLDLRY
jgi:hypothetical protein